MSEVQRMWRAVVWEKIFVKDERKDLSNLCKIGYVVWKRNMVGALGRRM